MLLYTNYVAVNCLKTSYSIYSGILDIKMWEILSFAVAWIDLEGIMLSEISQTEKEI